VQCREPAARREVQFPDFRVQIADFSMMSGGVAMDGIHERRNDVRIDD
jgi:hypothetical protein